MSAVIRRTMDAPGTFDSAGWLTVGFAGHQPKIGESYISSGSAYLCAVGFLPLGLPASDPFWSAPPEPGRQRRSGRARISRQIMPSVEDDLADIGKWRYDGAREGMPSARGGPFRM